MSVLELLNERMPFKKNVSVVLLRSWALDALNLVMYFGAAHPGCGHFFALGRDSPAPARLCGG
jgi:hypothetical protein